MTYDFHTVWHMNKKELAAVAKKIGLKGYSKLDRQQLLLTVTGTLFKK